MGYIYVYFFQELQYAQRYHHPQVGGESSYSEPDDQRPPSILKKPSRNRECKFIYIDPDKEILLA